MRKHAASSRGLPLRHLGILALSVVLVLALDCGAALAYRFGEPAVTAIGPEQRVFDWSTMSCEDNDIPDNPARAFRDNLGRVQLIASHAVVRRDVGPDLNSVQHQCPVIMNSHGSTDPARYDDREWLSSLYTPDGQTIFGLSHQEYEGWNYDETCAQWVGTFEQAKCWYNSINLVRSTNGGDSYSHATPPSHLVASAPYRYVGGTGPVGFFDPSNIIFTGGDIPRRPGDSSSYYYATVRAEAHGAQERGICLMRTSTLADPTSWRAWDGTGFGVRFINPYVETAAPPADHVCRVLSPGQLPYGNGSLTYSSHLRKYIFLAVGEKLDPGTGNQVGGFYYSLSDDLINWSEQQLLMEGELMWRHQCGDPNPVLYPVLIDPASTDRNFSTVGRHPYLYFSRFNYTYWNPNTCWMTLDRDLIRIPVEFAPPPNQPPSASFTASPNPAQAGQSVSFNGSASSDSDGSIANYRWDLDGNGTFETDTGVTATTSRTYTTAGTLTVRLRVTDSNGATNDTGRTLTVDPPPNQPPHASFTLSPNPAPTGQSVSFDGSASSDSDGSIANYRWDLDGNGSFETDTGTTATTSRSYATAGPVTVRLRVTDSSGDTNDTSRSLTIDSQPPVNQPPSASFTVSPNPAQTGQSVSFDGSASNDPDGTVAGYVWDLDGDGTFETDTGSTATTSRAYTGAGTLTVKLRVTDNDGTPSDTTGTLTIDAQNQLPSASFTLMPNPVQTGQSVSFDGSASNDPDGSITRHEWDLDGDGTFEFDAGGASTAARSYATARRFTIKLRVTDDRGDTTATSRTLTVDPHPGTGDPFPPPWPAPIPAPTAQPRVTPQCVAARRQRDRLAQMLRTARRKLAQARTGSAKRQYRLQIRSLNRRIGRLRIPACGAHRDVKPRFAAGVYRER